GLLVGGGLHHPAIDQLERYRQAIDDPKRARAFERALRATRDAGLDMIDPVLKRAPRGYPSHHPRIEHLRRKHLTAFRRHTLEPWLHEPACTQRVAAELEAAQPLVAWLAKHVGPSRLERRRR